MSHWTMPARKGLAAAAAAVVPSSSSSSSATTTTMMLRRNFSQQQRQRCLATDVSRLCSSPPSSSLPRATLPCRTTSATTARTTTAFATRQLSTTCPSSSRQPYAPCPLLRSGGSRSAQPPRHSDRHRHLSTHAPALAFKPAEPEEPNVYKNGDPSILLTDRAIKQLAKIASKDTENAHRLAFRIAVEPGGCHGYQYKMELEEAEDGQDQPGEDDDFRFQPSTPEGDSIPASLKDVTPLPILIDSVSLTLLKGSTIDYVTELIGSQFAIKDNPQAKGAGCGCGVSWEPNVDI